MSRDESGESEPQTKKTEAVEANMQRAAALDASLRAIIEAWPEIPEAMQRALAEMARSAATSMP